MSRTPKLKLVTGKLYVKQMEDEGPVQCFLCDDLVDHEGLPTAVAVTSSGGRMIPNPICNACVFAKLPSEFHDFYNADLRFYIAVEERDLLNIWIKERELNGKLPHRKTRQFSKLINRDLGEALDDCFEYDDGLTCDYFVAV